MNLRPLPLTLFCLLFFVKLLNSFYPSGTDNASDEYCQDGPGYQWNAAPFFFKQMVNSRVIETILLCIISVEIGASFPNTTIRASPQ